MAKKPVQTEPEAPQAEDTEFPGEDVNEGADPSDALGAVDFNVNDEYKPDPLAPKGVYHAVATKVSFNAAQFCIVWDWCLQNNGGVLNDGETPVDGFHVFSRNWLPKPGDEALMTASGRSTKRQSKINMLQDFQKALGIDMSTPQKIAEALNEQLWLGTEADLEVDVEEYQGKFHNTVNRVRKPA